MKENGRMCKECRFRIIRYPGGYPAPIRVSICRDEGAGIRGVDIHKKDTK